MGIGNRAVIAPRFPSLSIGPALLCICALGCGAQEPEWPGTLEERDGVLHVDNPPVPIWADTDAVFELELEQVFGANEEPKEAMLGPVRDLAVDADGNVYVLDQTDSSIVAFYPDGTVRWRAGRAGEAPGEINRPRGIVWDGTNRLYLLNQSGTRLDWWTTDGGYGDQFRLAETEVPSASHIGFLSPDRLALASSRDETEIAVVAPGTGWTRTDSFVVDGDGVSLGGGPVATGRVAIRGNELATGSIQDYRFRIYDGDGNLERVVERPDTGFVPVAIDDDRRAIAFMGGVEPPVRLAGGHLLVQAGWPTNIDDPAAWIRLMVEGNEPPEREYRHVLDLFDREGRWLANVTWDHPDRPDFGSIRSVGPDGRIYTAVSDPFPQVRRYRVVIEGPEDS